jgi:hypothetical protein
MTREPRPLHDDSVRDGWVPRLLAHDRRATRAISLDRATSRAEAPLVERAVRRQVRLPVPVEDLAGVEIGGGVVEIAVVAPLHVA